jgi:hypothetical protein
MFEQVSGSLDLPNIKKLDENQETFYYINFTKLQNVNDLVLVLASMGFGLSDKNPNFEEIKQFLDLDKPVRLK